MIESGGPLKATRCGRRRLLEPSAVPARRDIRAVHATAGAPPGYSGKHVTKRMEGLVGRALLLWLLGVPIPVIIILALLWR